MAVIKRLDLEESINNSIFEMGSGFGPSVLGLHLYGPSGALIDSSKKKVEIPIWDESLQILMDRDQVISETYQLSILPKLSRLFDLLTKSQGSFPQKEKLSGFKLRNFEYVRTILRDSYRGQFGLDDITASELFSKTSMNVKNCCVKFYLDKGNKFLYKLRFKQTAQSRFKYDSLFKALDNDEREAFPDFLERISSDAYEVWNENYRRALIKIYGDDMSRTLLGDYVGLTVIDLDDNRGKMRLEELASIGTKLSSPGFRLVKKRFDNHIDRLKEGRPGGLHYTFVDKGLSNYPFEVQYLDYESAVRDMFGPRKHIIYEIKGKKQAPDC